jgi:cell division protein FtsB
MKSETGRVRALDAVFSFFILAGLANFSYHALQGEFGVFALMRLGAEERTARTELAELRLERARLANLTARLSESGLDLDLLDERARAVLGYMRADEVTLR